MVAANGFSAAFPRSCASWLDWISNMSLIAASFTKSAVVGATPKTEFTPVFSPIDCASAGVASRTSAKLEARYLMVEPLPVWVTVQNQLTTLPIVPRILSRIGERACAPRHRFSGLQRFSWRPVEQHVGPRQAGSAR